MKRATPAFRSEALKAVPTRRASDAGCDTVRIAHYSIAAPCSTPQHLCLRLVTWLRCHTCYAGFLAASLLVLLPCPARQGQAAARGVVGVADGRDATWYAA